MTFSMRPTSTFAAAALLLWVAGFSGGCSEEGGKVILVPYIPVGGHGPGSEAEARPDAAAPATEVPKGARPATDAGADAKTPPRPAADETQPASAVLRGTVRFAGPFPAAIPLEVNHDKEACAAHPILSEDLVVSKAGGVANAVVWLEGVTGGKPWPDGDAVMDQVGCVYVPHVAVVGVDRPFVFTNSDPVIHNVNTHPKKNMPLNVSLLGKGMGRPVKKKLKLPDEIKVTCDAHQWMSAWIVVRDNPYFALTDGDGRFEIGGIPPGTYTLVVWHETLRRVQKQVVVAAGGERSEDVSLDRK